jgi:cytochrome c oxidase subunit IV
MFKYTLQHAFVWYDQCMSERKTHIGHIKTHASKRLQMNLRILSVVYVVLLVVTLYELFESRAVFSQALIALIIGLFAGLVSARMYKISWNENEASVIGRIDIYGVVVLVLFIIFEFNKNYIAGLIASGESVGSIALVLLTSALFGRILGTSKKIIKVLKYEKII